MQQHNQTRTLWDNPRIYTKNNPDFIHGEGAESFNMLIERIDLSIKEMFGKLITTSNGAIIEIAIDTNILSYSN